MSFSILMSIDLVNFSGFSAYMYTDDLAYKQLPERIKHYTIAQHLSDINAKKYRESNVWRARLSNNTIATIFIKMMDYYWENTPQSEFSIVDVGSQYAIFSLGLGRYIKSSRNANKIFAFDCGIAGKLAEYNVKLNQLDDIIKFEYKAVTNVSIPQLVYYDHEHSEDNHIVRRNFVNLPAYVVEGITLDDYFGKKHENLMIKIDVQGAEPLLFDGMQRILQDFGNQPPLIVFEFIPWVCRSVKDPAQFLTSLPQEYLLFDIDANPIAKDGNPLRQVKRDDLGTFVREISRKVSQSTDLLMLHENIINDRFKVKFERFLDFENPKAKKWHQFFT
jgi:FkbM family methyltransferase